MFAIYNEKVYKCGNGFRKSDTYFYKINAGVKVSHFKASAYRIVMLLGIDSSSLLKY